MLSTRFLFAASLCLALVPVTATRAETMMLGGREVEVSAPTGYCLLDAARPPEKAMIEALTQYNSEQTQLLVPFGRCDELVELRDGKRPRLDHFGQILALHQNGRLELVDAPPALFLESIAKPFPAASIAEVAANGEAQFKAPSDAQPSRLVAQLGRDDLAVYIGNTSIQPAGSSRIVIIGTIGVTLINQVPLSVNMFAVYDGGKDQGPGTIRGVLEELRRAVIDLHGVNELPAELAPQRGLRPPTADQWQKIGSSALVGGAIGALFGLAITAVVLVIRWRRRRRAQAQAA